MSIDFRWIFTGDTELCETAHCGDDRKYKTFLKEIYESGTNTLLLLNEKEKEFFKKI